MFISISLIVTQLWTFGMSVINLFVTLTLFRMGIFGAGPPSLKSVTHILKSCYDKTWHSYTLPKDPKNI